MDKVQLTKVEYTGEKYYHNFQHTETGEIKNVECTKESYEDVSLRDDSSKHPVSDDIWKWVGSNPKSVDLKELEFTEVDGKVYVHQGVGEMGFPLIKGYSQEEFKNLWQ